MCGAKQGLGSRAVCGQPDLPLTKGDSLRLLWCCSLQLSDGCTASFGHDACSTTLGNRLFGLCGRLHQAMRLIAVLTCNSSVPSALRNLDWSDKYQPIMNNSITDRQWQHTLCAALLRQAEYTFISYTDSIYLTMYATSQRARLHLPLLFTQSNVCSHISRLCFTHQGQQTGCLRVPARPHEASDAGLVLHAANAAGHGLTAAGPAGAL